MRRVMRWLKEAGGGWEGWGAPGSAMSIAASALESAFALGWCSGLPRSRFRLMILSRRTMAFVTFFGQKPLGRQDFLHIGQRLELSRRNVSTHSG